jgi:hypothetical protein
VFWKLSGHPGTTHSPFSGDISEATGATWTSTIVARTNSPSNVAGGFCPVMRSRNGTRIWLITEADRSCTTFLLPEEY